ncbi:acyl carrier protein [Streptomyces sp. BV286]|uniref:acyl carrier protein n=1 Tax=Streptomyces sp. BV286 TaxID=2849672 RepID=UPI001C2F04CC|nr:acyl carrier protein [Streptomyces sp. BV286]MBV1935722.1 acyl carrier protein [Streptomyces sp. BV286]
MPEFTLDDLKRILRASGGVDEQTDLDGEDFADTAFSDLGYDSLALLELTNRVEREYRIQIPDGDLEHTQTPREALTYVLARLTEAHV